MNVIADYNVLLKKFDETQIELNEAENNYRIIYPLVERKDSKFYIPDEKNSKIPINSFRSFNYVPSDHLISKGSPAINCTSESSEGSAFEEEFHRKKVYLKSAVISRLRKSESRKDAICKQNINQKVRTRNRRIMGMLQSTLKKFQDDAVKRRPQDLKRKALEQKVEAANEEEKKRMKREEAELCCKIKEKKLLLDCLKKMIQITESFEAWRSNKKKLLSFIITKAEPKICFLPVSHTLSSKKRLEKSRTEVQEDILKHTAAVKEELVEIQGFYSVT